MALIERTGEPALYARISNLVRQVLLNNPDKEFRFREVWQEVERLDKGSYKGKYSEHQILRGLEWHVENNSQYVIKRHSVVGKIRTYSYEPNRVIPNKPPQSA